MSFRSLLPTAGTSPRGPLSKHLLGRGVTIIPSLDVLGDWLGYWLAPNLEPTAGLPADATQWTDGSGNAAHMTLLKLANKPQVTETGVPNGIARILDHTPHQAIGHAFAAPATVSAWTTGTMFTVFNLDVDTAGNVYPLALTTNFASRELAIRVKTGSLELDFYLDRPEGTAGSSITWTPAVAKVISLATWYTVFAVHDGVGLKLYLNGIDTNAAFTEVENGGPALDETNWLANYTQQHTAIAAGARLEGDTTSITFGINGQESGAGLMEAALNATAVRKGHDFLNATLNLGI